MEAIEETIVVSLPVSSAVESWRKFQSLPDDLSSPESARPAPGSYSQTEALWHHTNSGTMTGTGPRTAWLSLDGKSHTGIVVFLPLDADNTRVSIRFTWPPMAPAPDITGARVLADLVRFKDFIESLPPAA